MQSKKMSCAGYEQFGAEEVRTEKSSWTKTRLNDIADFATKHDCKWAGHEDRIHDKIMMKT